MKCTFDSSHSFILLVPLRPSWASDLWFFVLYRSDILPFCFCASRATSLGMLGGGNFVLQLHCSSLKHIMLFHFFGNLNFLFFEDFVSTVLDMFCMVTFHTLRILWSCHSLHGGGTLLRTLSQRWFVLHLLTFPPLGLLDFLLLCFLMAFLVWFLPESTRTHLLLRRLIHLLLSLTLFL